jgi:hypothetical protein
MRPPRATLMLQAPAADKKIPPKALTRQLDGLFDSLVRPALMNAMFVATSVGLIGGALVGYWLSKTLALKLSKRASGRRIVNVCASLGALLSLVPACFLSFVVGGNLGGSWGEVASAPLGAEKLGVPIGLSIGIALTLGVGLTVGTLLGGLAGKALSNLLPNQKGRAQSFTHKNNE